MPESKDKDQTSDPAAIAMLTEEMVAACRKAYGFDGEIEAPVRDLWRKYQAQGVSREIWKAAKNAAQPQTSELFKRWLRRVGEASEEFFRRLDDDEAPLQ